MESLLDTTIGAWRLLRLLASGGMAAVFEAEHVINHTPAAVKVLRRDLRRSVDPIARLVQEGRVIISLLHEHIVRVYEYGTAEEAIAFIVMERLHGRTLGDLIENEKQIAPSRAAFIARQLCDGLGAAHARGIYHRDVKPANIFLCEDQRHRDFVKVLDFGIAKLDAGDPSKLAATATGMTLGTPEYMSPEQATASEIDARSDVYQVGVVLFEMLSGNVPFTGRNPVTVMQKHLQTPPPSLKKLVPGIGAELERIVAKCLAKEPEGRFQSCRELADALDRIAEHDTSHEGLRTVVDDITATVVGNLRLPALGNRGDLVRYSRNLHEGLARLFPNNTAPSEIRGIQGAIESLQAAQSELQMEVTARRADADDMARTLETRIAPIERAIRALREDKSVVEGRLREAQDTVDRLEERLRALDAEYAVVYDQVEQHQQTLYNSAATGTKSVDFRDLFQEDIATNLRRLGSIYAQRAEQTEPVDVRRQAVVQTMRQIADIEMQITHLDMSRLNLEAERSTRLAEREFLSADAERRMRAVERALEHHHLQLGLAFRHAIADLMRR